MRCFLGIRIPQPIAFALDEYISSRCQALPSVRWIPVGKYHITIHFFGEIEETDTGRVDIALEPILSRVAPFQLQLTGFNSFHEEFHRHSVLWAAVHDLEGGLHDCFDMCEEAIQTIGEAQVFPTFTPHCTVGRLHGTWDSETEHRWEDICNEGPKTVPFTVEKISFIESPPAGTGNSYRDISTFTLGQYVSGLH